MARGRGRHMEAIALGCGEGCPAGLLDQLPQGVFWKDLRLRYLGCNSVFLDRIGLDSAEELLGRTDSQLLDPEAARAFEDTDRKVLACGEPVTEVYREESAGGEGPRWIETLKKPLADGNGKTVGILGITLDVTDRMVSQAALEESEKLNRAVMEHAPIGISVRESNGRLLYANRAWRKIWNLSAEEVERDMSTPRSFFRFDDNDTYLGDWMGRVRRVYSEGGQLSIPELHVDTPPREGTARWISHHYYAISDHRGMVDRVVVLTEDITSRKKNQQAARETAEQYRALTGNLPVGIFRFSVEGGGRLTRVNPALARMFGMEGTGELLQTDTGDLFARPEDRRRLAGMLLRRGSVEAQEVLLRKSDGSTFYGEVHARAVSGTDDRVRYVDGSLSDVTARKTATRRLRASLESLGRMTDSTVSAMSLLVDQRDPYTAGHQRQVARLAGAIGRDLGLSEDEVACIRTAGLLHDIGKMCVPTEILTKPGRISRMEYNLIRGHPTAGAEILGSIEFPWPVADVVLQHHERLDGSGYPRGLRGTGIRIESRILAVADVVDAMSSHRPYRPALGTDAALEMIRDAAGTLFDPEAVASCLRLFSRGFRLSSYGPSLSADPMERLRND
ncbi:MAG: PAS domain S-box protein [Candidatus Fermentibacteraceae bacterium]